MWKAAAIALLSDGSLPLNGCKYKFGIYFFQRIGDYGADAQWRLVPQPHVLGSCVDNEMLFTLFNARCFYLAAMGRIESVRLFLELFRGFIMGLGSGGVKSRPPVFYMGYHGKIGYVLAGIHGFEPQHKGVIAYPRQVAPLVEPAYAEFLLDGYEYKMERVCIGQVNYLFGRIGNADKINYFV